MRLTINGVTRDLDLGDAPTVEALVRAVAQDGVPCAVEVNRRVIPLAQRGGATLREGDFVEIVTLVGGG